MEEGHRLETRALFLLWYWAAHSIAWALPPGSTYLLLLATLLASFKGRAEGCSGYCLSHGLVVRILCFEARDAVSVLSMNRPRTYVPCYLSILATIQSLEVSCLLLHLTFISCGFLCLKFRDIPGVTCMPGQCCFLGHLCWACIERKHLVSTDMLNPNVCTSIKN